VRRAVGGARTHHGCVLVGGRLPTIPCAAAFWRVSRVPYKRPSQRGPIGEHTALAAGANSSTRGAAEKTGLFA